MSSAIHALTQYALDRGLIEEADRQLVFNRLLEIMELDEEPASEFEGGELHEILDALCADAAARGIIDSTVTAHDLFDTKLMGALTPMPREVRRSFAEKYAAAPEEATDWFYRFCTDVNYIRRDRIEKDMKWTFSGKYGELDITVNLSKPEKDPRDIAAARLAPQAGYPKCQLCAENEGYAGRMNHPARQNHRIIPLTLDGKQWYFQYSPYVYYNEHCIVFNAEHTPMKIDRSTFRRMLDFVREFPHYFIGSNADLPIVGGSILSHDHFQGGCYEFAMARAERETELCFKGFEDVEAETVRWPLSVIRLRCDAPQRIEALADRILTAWRGYTDESASIYAETDGVPHNTVTPIARRRGEKYEMDLVLRCNITTAEHPLGVFHPHAKLHHIKKENIGLIEVMGLAVLPSRLKGELCALAETVTQGRDIRADEAICKHAEWLDGLKARYTFTEENAAGILQYEVGKVFEEVLEDAGVFKTDPEGRAAFLQFINYVNRIM